MLKTRLASLKQNVTFEFIFAPTAEETQEGGSI